MEEYWFLVPMSRLAIIFDFVWSIDEENYFV